MSARRSLLPLLPRLVFTLGLLALAPGCALFAGFASAEPAEPTPEQRRENYLREHPETDPAIAEAIREGAVAEGMTTAELRASLGRPRVRQAGQDFGGIYLYFETVAYGTKTEFGPGGPVESRTFSGVRDLKVSLVDERVVGVDDLGYQTRDQLMARCRRGSNEACNRVSELDSRAASQPQRSE